MFLVIYTISRDSVIDPTGTNNTVHNQLFCVMIHHIQLLYFTMLHGKILLIVSLSLISHEKLFREPTDFNPFTNSKSVAPENIQTI